MSNDFKVKLIKNASCILGGLLIMVFFIVFYGKDGFYSNLPKILPFLMVELVIGVFSFYWSISRANKQTLFNALTIIVSIAFAFAYIIFASVCAVNGADASVGLKVATMIFFVLSWIGIAYCMFDPIYIDFFSDKKKEIKP